MTTETDLIKVCIEGDRRMQKELYDRFSPKMYAVCLRYMGNADDAQDILQEGFIKIYKNLERFRGDGSFEGWVRRIFVNTAIEQIRKKKMDVSLTEKEETIEYKSVSAVDTINEKDLLKIVSGLSPGYRSVFNMYVVEGYQHYEIAEVLGITESTSRSALCKARNRLALLIKKQDEVLVAQAS